MERLKVLIVDDEAPMGLAVERALKNYIVRLPEVDVEVGFDTSAVTTGEEALSLIETAPPDILLLDHKLPGISGLDVLGRLAKRDYDLLTIMITAYASLENAIIATKRGAHEFLAKPFTPDELKASVYKTAKHLLLQRQARRLAQEKRRVRFEFISVLAHELKAPLAAVEQYLNILEDSMPVQGGNDASRQMVTRSLVRIQGMRKLIMDLLDLTRIESGQKKREMTVLDVREIAKSAMDTLSLEAEKRGIAMELHASGPVLMTADRWEIEVVLNNLISNAVKYNRDQGRVDVAIEEHPDRVIISVTDTGIGISEEDAGRLFNEFVRVKDRRTEHILGSGLGLSIVKKIAMLYDGEVSVKSQPDAGSTFTVVLKRLQEN
jgi:two-component system sensor histidine kinase/response regulator